MASPIPSVGPVARRAAQAAGWPATLIGALSLSVLGMHAYLGSFSRFMGDDYCSAAQEHRFGILRAAWYWFRTWNGRYSANVLDAVFGALGPGFTPAVTALVLITWLAVLAAAVFMLGRGVAAGASLSLPSVALAAAILVLTLELSPDVPQALYWGQGMRAIVPPLIIGTAYVAVFAARLHRDLSGGALAVWLLTGFALTFGAGGFSETYTALQLAALVLALAVWFFASRRTLTKGDILFLSAGLAGALLSFVTVIASPGNAARAAYYPPPPALPELLRISLGSYSTFLLSLSGSATKLFSLPAALLAGLWAGLSPGVQNRNWRLPLLILAIGFILTFACFPPAAYGESSAPPERTQLIPTFLLTLALVALGISLAGWFAPRRHITGLLSPGIVLLLLVVAALSIHRMAGLQPEYEAYARAWSSFDTQMKGFREAGVKSAELSTEQLNANNWARLNTLGNNPKFWLNQCVSDYYGVNVISTTR